MFVVRSTLLAVLLPLASVTAAELPPPRGSTATAVFARPDDGADRAAASGVQARMEAALRAQGLDLVDRDAAFPRTPPPANGTSGADAVFAEGQKAYDQLDGEKAAERFEEALALYAKRAGDVPTNTLVRSLVFLGAARRLAGDEEGAREAFVGALQLDPGFTPESKLIDNEVIDALEQVRAQLATGPTSTLEVSSLPAGATVRTGPKTFGPTPLEATVPAGLYVLTVTRGGWEPGGALARASAGEIGRAHVVLEEVPGHAAIREVGEKLASIGAFKQRELPLEAKAVADRMGARYLVLAVVRPGGAEVQGWDVVTGNRLKGLTVDPRDQRSFDAAAVRIREFQGRPAPLGAPTLSNEPLVKKWWFWAAVGGAAVGITAGLLIATQPDRTSGPVASATP